MPSLRKNSEVIILLLRLYRAHQVFKFQIGFFFICRVHVDGTVFPNLNLNLIPSSSITNTLAPSPYFTIAEVGIRFKHQTKQCVWIDYGKRGTSCQTHLL